MSRRILLVFFSLLFFSGFLVFIIIPLILQSGIVGVTDLVYRLLYFGLASLLLVVVYHLRTGGSPRQLRVFWTVVVALVFAFPFAAVCWVIARALIGPPPTLFIPLYLVGLALGMLIGYWVGKRAAKEEESSNLDLS
nr:hypothetical protein [Candidatus Njordarchaeota archaeon]